MAEISQEDFEKLQSELNQQEVEKTTDGIIKKISWSCRTRLRSYAILLCRW